MQKVQLTGTDLILSPMGLGTAEYGAGVPVEAAEEQMDAYLAAGGNLLSMGGLTVNTDTREAITDGGEAIHFTPTEFTLLVYLIENASRAVSRAELLPAVWGFENNSATRVADDTIKRLRKKLAGTRLLIDTIWGYGFRAKEI
jgi:DNA-binding response OmpR family regulator